MWKLFCFGLLVNEAAVSKAYPSEVWGGGQMRGRRSFVWIYHLRLSLTKLGGPWCYIQVPL